MDAVCANHCLCIFASIVISNVIPILAIVLAAAGNATLPAALLGVSPESMFFVLLLLMSATVLLTFGKWQRQDEELHAAGLIESESEGEPALSGDSESEEEQDDDAVYEDSDEPPSSSALRE
jgi:hypothetical protein